MRKSREAWLWYIQALIAKPTDVVTWRVAIAASWTKKSHFSPRFSVNVEIDKDVVCELLETGVVEGEFNRLWKWCWGTVRCLHKNPNKVEWCFHKSVDWRNHCSSSTFCDCSRLSLTFRPNRWLVTHSIAQNCGDKWQKFSLESSRSVDN